MAKPIEYTERISTFITPETLDALKINAKKKGMTVSGFIRMLIHEDIDEMSSGNNIDEIFTAPRHYTEFDLAEELSAPIPEKERLIVQKLRDFVDSDPDYNIALVAGIRKVGKTTALRQLEASVAGSVFIDFTEAGVGYQTIRTALLDQNTSLLLLDEFARLDNFDKVAQYVHDMTVKDSRIVKVIMTGSSAAHITKLRDGKLGGARARLFRLPPVMFVEYLYLTGKISNYTDYSNVSNEQFGEYLMLDGLPSTLQIQFNRQYFNDFYNDVQNSNNASCLTSSLVDLEPGDLQALADIIAYKLSESRRYGKVMSPAVGEQEARNIQRLHPEFDEAGIDLSDAFMTGSKGKAANITSADKGRILSFLLWAGLANVEVTKRDDTTKLIGVYNVDGELRCADTEDKLTSAFKKASVCFTSPLFYTRLGRDIYEKYKIDAKELFVGGRILGLMFEVYVRGIFTTRTEDVLMSAVKLSYAGKGEADIYDEHERLLCELSVHNKDGDEVNVQKYFEDEELIRVCTSWDKDDVYNGVQHIPYAKFCCMLDTGDIFRVPRRKPEARKIINRSKDL